MTAALVLIGRLVGETDPAVPGLREGLSETDVSPGLLGFLVIFAAVVACIPLLRSMVSKIRGVQHRDLPPEDVAGTGAVAGPDDAARPEAEATDPRA